MQCDQVQDMLASEGVGQELQKTIDSHLAGCALCRNVQRLYAQVDEELKHGPYWEPSAGFRDRVVAQGSLELLSVAPVRRSPSPLAWGVGAAATSYILSWLLNQFSPSLVRTALASSAHVAWVSTVISLGISAWFTRRALQ